MILLGATAPPNATSSSTPYPISSTLCTVSSANPSTNAKSNTINPEASPPICSVTPPSVGRVHSGSSAVVFLSRQRIPNSRALTVAALFVLLNLANWPCAQCDVDAQLVRDQSYVAAEVFVEGLLTSDKVYLRHEPLSKGDHHDGSNFKIINSHPHSKRHSQLAIDCLQTSACSTQTPSQAQRVKSGWRTLAIPKRTIRKRLASAFRGKRKTKNPLPRDQPIDDAPPTLHHDERQQQPILGPSTVGADSDGRTRNDTTISQTTISGNGGTQEESSLALPTFAETSPSNGSSPNHPQTSSFSTVDRFKTSIAFEAAAKQRVHDREKLHHYDGVPSTHRENHTYPAHITRHPHNVATGKGYTESGADTIFNDNDVVVTLLGLFELSTKNDSVRSDGHSELAAARLAVRHINQQQLLPGYRLELVTNDTKVRQKCSLVLICLGFYTTPRCGTAWIRGGVYSQTGCAAFGFEIKRFGVWTRVAIKSLVITLFFFFLHLGFIYKGRVPLS